jgi:hypothetical protein
MNGAVDGRDAVDEDGLLDRLAENRATMDGLRQHTARVSESIAATERAVAGTLRRLAEQDREQGRTGAADRREARAEEAERFADRESAAAERLTERPPPTATAPDAAE